MGEVNQEGSKKASKSSQQPNLQVRGKPKKEGRLTNKKNKQIKRSCKKANRKQAVALVLVRWVADFPLNVSPVPLSSAQTLQMNVHILQLWYLQEMRLPSQSLQLYLSHSCWGL